ncbi:phosphoadenosine phosphosulfate reductase family protein [Streptomyces sp. NPDC058677]|uniref:phosphoadenosine phosphosulfate reductase domain-containing protein n=1 Tax=Streptomyces sp. NPDC058677 TaxID=3346594 RepID=UPI00365E8896
MSARTAKRQPVLDALPGMPDVLKAKPAKATDDEAWKARTLDEAIARTYELLDQTISKYSTGRALVARGERVIDYGLFELLGLFVLYSGGNDSVVLQHLVRKYMRDRGIFRRHFGGIIHVNTGTAIEQTTQHVRESAAAWGWKLHELQPRVTYLDLVLGNVLSTRGPNKGRPVWLGFPGPGGDSHNVMYMRLKDEPLQTFRRRLVGPTGGIRRKVIYVGGMRWAESQKRFRTAAEVDVDGAIVWLSALVHWTNEHMREYRARYRCQQQHKHSPHRLCGPEALPLNEVTEHLHMSGDCACGAYAKPGELEERRFFYPKNAARIDEWQRAVEAAGIAACKWGERPPSSMRQPKGRRVKERLCAACAPPLDGQTDILDDWRERGLLSDEQYATFTRPAA